MAQIIPKVAVATGVSTATIQAGREIPLGFHTQEIQKYDGKPTAWVAEQ